MTEEPTLIAADCTRYRLGFYVEVEQAAGDSTDAVMRASLNTDRLLDLDWNGQRGDKAFFVAHGPRHDDEGFATTLIRVVPLNAHPVEGNS